MLAALEAGLPLDTSFQAPSRLETSFRASGPAGCGGNWCPRNANPEWMNGERTMWDGLGRSVNTYFAWLTEQVGADAVVAVAQRLGIQFRATADAHLAREGAAAWGSFTLGVSDTTPLDLAAAYATLAADGVHCAPLPVLTVTNRHGDPVPVAEPACSRVISRDVARAVTDAARCPVGQQSAYDECNGGTGRVASRLVDGRPLAGKTGSTERNRTETFVGFTPRIAVAAIAANPDDPRDAVGAAVLDDVIEAVSAIIVAVEDGQRALQFTAPSRAIAYGEVGARD